jgi:hypothetical protein
VLISASATKGTKRPAAEAERAHSGAERVYLMDGGFVDTTGIVALLQVRDSPLAAHRSPLTTGR